MNKDFKVGNVAIVGRPNVGKSTLLNALIGQKVAAVSPRPQTTQTPVQAFFEDERGQIFFIDTPGLFHEKSHTHHNALISQSMEDADLIIYVVDHTRPWGHEEDLIWHLVQTSRIPTVLVINKIDDQENDYSQEYRRHVQADVETVLEMSGKDSTHLKSLINEIFRLIPIRERNTTVDNFVTPILSHDSLGFIEELIREKIYQFTTEEVPYQTSVVVEEITEKKPGALKVVAQIQVAKPRYRPILIGAKGQMVKQIGSAVRKELILATNKKVSIKLTVVG